MLEVAANAVSPIPQKRGFALSPRTPRESADHELAVTAARENDELKRLVSALRVQLSVRTAEADAAVSRAVELGKLLEQSNTPVPSPQQQLSVPEAGKQQQQQHSAAAAAEEDEEEDVAASSPGSRRSATRSSSPASAGEELWI